MQSYVDTVQLPISHIHDYWLSNFVIVITELYNNDTTR